MECYQWVVWMMLLICRILWWVKVMCCREVVVILQRGPLRVGITAWIYVCSLNFKRSHFVYWIGAHIAVSILPLILCVLITFAVSSHLHVISLSPNSAQNQFLLTISIDYREQSLRELTKWSQREKYLIFYQILSTNSSRKCMEISLENLYADIGP